MSKGFGHVRKRGLNSYAAYWYENGEQRYRGRFRTEDEAQTFLTRKAAELTYGISVEPTQLTVAQYLDLWLAGKHDITSGTRNTYRARIEHAIKPGVGTISLQQLTTPAVRAWLNDMLSDGHSASYVRFSHTLLKAALEDATDEQLIHRNPARSRSIRLPVARRKKVKVWDEDEVARFLAHVADDPQAALYRLLVATQVRIGEAVALRWSDLDLGAGRLRVQRTWEETSRTFSEHAKSSASDRVIDFDLETATILMAHRDREQFRSRSGRWAFPELVFHGARGGVLSPRVADRLLRARCREAGVPVLAPHGLRHTGATLLLKQGVPIHVVSRRLGHARIQTTIDLYAHVLPSQQREAAEQMARVMDGS